MYPEAFLIVGGVSLLILVVLWGVFALMRKARKRDSYNLGDHEDFADNDPRLDGVEAPNDPPTPPLPKNVATLSENGKTQAVSLSEEQVAKIISFFKEEIFAEKTKTPEDNCLAERALFRFFAEVALLAHGDGNAAGKAKIEKAQRALVALANKVLEEVPGSTHPDYTRAQSDYYEKYLGESAVYE